MKNASVVESPRIASDTPSTHHRINWNIHGVLIQYSYTFQIDPNPSINTPTGLLDIPTRIPNDFIHIPTDSIHIPTYPIHFPTDVIHILTWSGHSYSSIFQWNSTLRICNSRHSRRPRNIRTHAIYILAWSVQYQKKTICIPFVTDPQPPSATHRRHT